MAVSLAFTLHEASQILRPPLTERQLRQIVSALGWQPSGSRRNGHRGHPVWTYDSDQIMALHEALVPFMSLGCVTTPGNGVL